MKRAFSRSAHAWRSTAGKVAALAIAATGAMALGPVTLAQASTWAGCPDGAVCIYPQNQDNSTSNPEAVFWSYGYHNLSNEYGLHEIANNQTGGASLDLCYGYNGTNCTVPNGHIAAGAIGVNFDFTPINSVRLNPWP